MSNIPVDESAETPVTRRGILTAAAATVGAAALTGTASAQEAPGEFAGKTAFITGAARGIGRACAETLAAGGANIVLFDIADQIPEVPYPLATPEDMSETKSAIEAMGVGCLSITGDVRDFDAQKSAIDQAIAEFGSLDYAIANAGITQVGFIESFDEDELSLVIDINLKGVIKTLQAATPVMRGQNSGRIVVMSSVTGRAGSANFPIYSATKWAVVGLAKSTALALGRSNVTCNAVCPTLVNTKLLDNEYVLSQIVPGQPLTFEQFNEGAKTRHILPVGLYEPSRVGDTVRFLCSDAAALISGDVFDIGAGLNAQFPA
ncbi:MAG: SDR family NAD(P)-dependent oxidoreductase [Pseudomonadota bacterium]